MSCLAVAIKGFPGALCRNSNDCHLAVQPKLVPSHPVSEVFRVLVGLVVGCPNLTHKLDTLSRGSENGQPNLSSLVHCLDVRTLACCQQMGFPLHHYKTIS